VHGGAADGSLKLQLPQRFADGTWMAAAWRVLAGVGPEGMHIDDVSVVSVMFLCSMYQFVPSCGVLRAPGMAAAWRVLDGGS
jgi:hypothetical protein